MPAAATPVKYECNSNKANLRDLIAATGLVILLKLDSNLRFFLPVWPWNSMEDLKKQQGTSSTLNQALCIISKPSVNSNWSYSPETPNLGQNWWFLLLLCDLEIWWMTLKNNRAHLLCHLKICASFHQHMWIQTGVPVWKPLNHYQGSPLRLWPQKMTVFSGQRWHLDPPFTCADKDLCR